MNKIKLIILLAVFISLGYLLGNFFPFYSSQTVDKDIQGDTLLKVRIVTEGNDPVPNVEVDVAKGIGQPPLGGVVLTNSEGVATFNIKPGDYFVFFNSSNFPAEFNYPEPLAISVKEGIPNNQTVVLFAK